MCFGTLLAVSFLSSQSSQSRIWHIFTMQKLAVAKTSTVLVWIIALSHSLCFLFHCSMHICTVGFNMFCSQGSSLSLSSSLSSSDLSKRALKKGKEGENSLHVTRNSFFGTTRCLSPVCVPCGARFPRLSSWTHRKLFPLFY